MHTHTVEINADGGIDSAIVEDLPTLPGVVQVETRGTLGNGRVNRLAVHFDNPALAEAFIVTLAKIFPAGTARMAN